MKVVGKDNFPTFLDVEKLKKTDAASNYEYRKPTHKDLTSTLTITIHEEMNHKTKSLRSQKLKKGKKIKLYRKKK